MDYREIANEMYIYYFTKNEEHLEKPMEYFRIKLKEKYFSFYRKKYPVLDSNRRIVKKLGRKTVREDLKNMEKEFVEKLEMCMLIFDSHITDPQSLLDEIFYFVTENRYIHALKRDRPDRKNKVRYRNVLSNGIIKKERI